MPSLTLLPLCPVAVLIYCMPSRIHSQALASLPSHTVVVLPARTRTLLWHHTLVVLLYSSRYAQLSSRHLFLSELLPPCCMHSQTIVSLTSHTLASLPSCRLDILHALSSALSDSCLITLSHCCGLARSHSHTLALLSDHTRVLFPVCPVVRTSIPSS